MSQPPKIIVFLKNKLITCDVIVPIMLEISQKFDGGPVEFVALEPQTAEGIRNNVVLHDAIREIGCLTTFQRRDGVLGWLARKLALSLLLLRVAVSASVRPVVFIHFTELDRWPLRLLFLINRSRTYLCETVGVGYSRTELVAANVDKPRSSRRLSAARGLLAFSEFWAQLRNDNFQNVPKYVLGPPHCRQHWLDYVSACADRYLDANLNAADVPPDKELIAVMLGTLGDIGIVENPGDMPRLLDETLEVLEPYADRFAIILKPHVITDMKHLQAILGRRQGQFVISHLHPAVLATRAKCFICNLYSTTLSNAHYAGVPTIEYSNYAKALLKETDGKSMREDFVDYFINNDRVALQAAIAEVLDRPRARQIHSGLTNNPDSIFERIALGSRIEPDMAKVVETA